MALGELYARYSLLEAHDGNSFCLTAPFSSSLSSPRFQGNTDSIAVGVVTRYSPVRGRCTRNENTHEHDLCVCVCFVAWQLVKQDHLTRRRESAKCKAYFSLHHFLPSDSLENRFVSSGYDVSPPSSTGIYIMEAISGFLLTFKKSLVFREHKRIIMCTTYRKCIMIE